MDFSAAYNKVLGLTKDVGCMNVAKEASNVRLSPRWYSDSILSASTSAVMSGKADEPTGNSVSTNGAIGNTLPTASAKAVSLRKATAAAAPIEEMKEVRFIVSSCPFTLWDTIGKFGGLKDHFGL